MKIFIVLILLIVPNIALAGIISTVGTVAALSAASSASSTNSKLESKQSEFKTSNEDIKAVVKCEINDDGKCRGSYIEVKQSCHWYGCDGYYQWLNFQERAIKATGHKDARIIGVNMHEENLYVTWN